MGSQLGDIPDGHSVYNDIEPRKLPKPTDIDKVKKTIKQTSDHPDVLDEVLADFYDGRNETIDSRHPAIVKKPFIEAKDRILSHYRSVEEIEAAVGEDETWHNGQKMVNEPDYDDLPHYESWVRNQLRAEIRKALGLEG